MTAERKKLCLYVGINFVIGVILGILLFFAHMRSNPIIHPEEYSYDKTVGIIDVIRVWWMNLMWCFSVFIAHTILPLAAIHIIVGLRGAVSSFSVLYLLKVSDIKAVVASVLPQCLSVLPILMMFSTMCVEKRRNRLKDGKEPFIINRREVYVIFLISAVAAVTEAAFFVVLCRVLF